jgi:hypothetical protein
MPWAIAQTRLLHYGPLRIFCLSAMGHSNRSGWALGADSRFALGNSVCRISGIGDKSDLNGYVTIFTWPCIQMYMAVYLCASGCVSTCMWPFIHMHVILYSCVRGHVSTYIWPCIIHVHMACIHLHVVVYPHAEYGYLLWAIAQNFYKCYGPKLNFVMAYGPQNIILLSTTGYSAEIIDNSTEWHEIHWKACHNL